MQTANSQFSSIQATSPAPSLQKYPPLDQVNRPAITTDEAAHYLNRKSQTLRTWACYENGPILPIRINGRLAWQVSEIKALLKTA